MKFLRKILAIFAAFSLFFCYLVPNNNPPWNSAQSEFFAITAILIYFLISKKSSSIYWVDFFWAALVIVAFLTSIKSGFFAYSNVLLLYAVVSCVAYRVGINDEKRFCFNGVCVALIISSIISVGIQVVQIISREELYFPWVLEFPYFNRPYANLGQPNQLATLFLTSFFCVMCLLYGKRISFLTGGVVILLLAFGLALASSKTSLLSIVVSIIFLAIYKEKKALYLTIFLLISVLFFHFLLEDRSRDYLHSEISTGRFSMWKMLLYSLSLRPIFGYGFYNTIAANFEVINLFPERFGLVTAHAHNLFLDFFIWFGIPIGGGITFFLLKIAFNTFKFAEKNKKIIEICIIIPMVMHAMLEFPLYYAYFLLPFSFFIGELRINEKPIMKIKNIDWVFFAVSSFLLFSLVFEYLNLERRVTEQRFYLANFEKSVQQTIPSYFLLDLPAKQLEFMILGEIREENLYDLEKTVVHYPTYRNFYFLCDFYFKNNNKEKLNFIYNKALSTLKPEEAFVFKQTFEKRFLIKS